jgi:hypothetical protein
MTVNNWFCEIGKYLRGDSKNKYSVPAGLPSTPIQPRDFGGETYGGLNLPTGDDSGLWLVDFSLFPHLDHERFPENSSANAERWAANIPVPTYAIDDQTAIKVTGGAVEVISEGHWKLFTP